MKTWNFVFDSNGMFQHKYDPFRYNDKEFHDYIFDDEGNINEFEFDQPLWGWIGEQKPSWESDAVKLYYAEIFSSNTKGNYSAIYMWR